MSLSKINDSDIRPKLETLCAEGARIMRDDFGCENSSCFIAIFDGEQIAFHTVGLTYSGVMKVAQNVINSVVDKITESN